MDAELDLLINLNIVVTATAIAAIEIIRLEEEVARNKKRRFWMKEILRKRDTEGTFNLLIPQILSDGEQYRNFFRMSKASFSFLLDIVLPALTRQDTNCRRAIRADEKLAITLRYLATG
jgi:hypothetical protein